MESSESKKDRALSIAFIIVLVVVALFTVIGMIAMHHQPLALQGQVEATGIHVSDKLPGRIDTLLAEEGQWVKQEDTLAVINSPTMGAKYRQVDALKQVAVEQSKKIDAGTREQIIVTTQQLWDKTQSGPTLARATYSRILALYKDSAVTSRRKGEVKTMYKAVQTAKRTVYEQYQMAVDGTQSEDKVSAHLMVNTADSTADEVSSLLVNARPIAPEDRQVATIFPERGELVALGTSIMNLVMMDDIYVVLSVREGLVPSFRMGDMFIGDVPVLAQKGIGFRVYYISPLGSLATWRLTKRTGSYNLQAFEVRTRPIKKAKGLRPGMSVLAKIKQRNEYDSLRKTQRLTEF